MRLLSFEDAGHPAIGLRIGAEVVEIGHLGPDVPATMPALLAKGPEFLTELAARAAAAPRRPLDGLALPSPAIRRFSCAARPRSPRKAARCCARAPARSLTGRRSSRW